MAAGASVNVSSFTSSPHVGTHADAPLHVREGWSGSHELSLDAFFGPAIVVDVSTLEKQISIEDLEKIQSLPFVERLLLRTGRTIASGAFPEDWPTLSESCVRTLLGRGLRLLMVKMLKRIFLVSIAIALLALFIHAQQQRSGKRAKRSSRDRTTSKRKPARPPVTSFVSDSGGGELIVRLLDVGQGDASYI